MTQDPNTEGRGARAAGDGRTTRFLGSLKDALAAASREETASERRAIAETDHDGHPDKSQQMPPPVPEKQAATTSKHTEKQAGDNAAATVPSAASAAKAVRGTSRSLEEQQIKLHKLPTTRVVKASEISGGGDSKEPAAAAPRTQLVRGKQKVERGEFEQDPVVGWLVVVGGPGIGSYRPIFEGNNSVGRGSQNRIPIDFGDEAISSEEQAYIRYDSSDRSFLFVPNLAKTNVVSVNNQKPTGAVALNQMDVIMMGRTQLVFVPFCGSEFDWSALSETTKG